MDHQKKILIFSLVYQPFMGGAEYAIKEITDRIGAAQFDMVTLRFDSSLPKFEKIGNINVYRIGFSKDKPSMADLIKFPLMLNKFLFPFMAALKAVKLNKKNSPREIPKGELRRNVGVISQGKYDAVWAMMAAYAGFAALIFKIIKPEIPYLLTLQEGDPIETIRKKVRFVYPFFRNIFKKASYIQAISNFLADWAKQEGASCPIETIPNAVDIKKFSQIYTLGELKELKENLKINSDEKIIITTSRLVLKNGVDDLIKAGKYLDFPFKILILGIGPDEEKLKKLVWELKLRNRIIFLGEVSHKEMPKYLKISDVFCRPSLSEGLGNSFLEAMLAGLPVIGTPVGGIPDFLKDKETGLFCEVRNPKDLAEKIKLLLSDKNLREKIIENSQKLIREKYDWELIAAKMKNIFLKLK